MLSRRGEEAETAPMSAVLWLGLAVIMAVVLIFAFTRGISDQGDRIQDAASCEGLFVQAIAGVAGAQEGTATGICSSSVDCRDLGKENGYYWMPYGEDDGCEKKDLNKKYCCLRIPELAKGAVPG